MRLPNKRVIIALSGLLIVIVAGGLFVYAESVNNGISYLAVTSTPVPVVYSVADDNTSANPTPWPSPPPNVTVTLAPNITPNSNGSYTVIEGNQTFIESYTGVIGYELSTGKIDKPPGATVVTGNGSYPNALVPKDPLGLPSEPGVTEPENLTNATSN